MAQATRYPMRGDPEDGAEDCHGSSLDRFPDYCPHDVCFPEKCACCEREDKAADQHLAERPPVIYVNGTWRCGFKDRGMWRACQRRVNERGERCYHHRGK